MAEETGGAGTPTTREAIRQRAKERSREALKLRTMRVGYDDIARTLGYANRSAAYKAVQRELKNIPFEATVELRRVELESLDVAERSLSMRVARGELGAIDRVLKIKDHRAKLTGLYEDPVDSGVEEVKTVLTAWFASVQRAVDHDEGTDGEQ